MFTYFTIDDLSEYMGIDIKELPSNADSLMKRASELISLAIKRNYKPDSEAHKTAAKLAACAQCEYWIENGIKPSSNGNISSYSLGELSVSLADSRKLSTSTLCDMAISYLNGEYLLYKGMRC